MQELELKRVSDASFKRGQRLGLTRLEAKKLGTSQYSTILGAIPKKPHMMRAYGNISSVHRKKSAEKFIKAMLLLSNESSKIFEQHMPEAFKLQKKLVQDSTLEKFRFGSLFTSTISNANISAPIHIDSRNLKGSLNFIYNVRQNCSGGDLHFPEYGITLPSLNNSLIVYPAWRNFHGVTEIKPLDLGKPHYRNSHIFYALSGLEG